MDEKKKEGVEKKEGEVDVTKSTFENIPDDLIIASKEKAKGKPEDGKEFNDIKDEDITKGL